MLVEQACIKNRCNYWSNVCCRWTCNGRLGFVIFRGQSDRVHWMILEKACRDLVICVKVKFDHRFRILGLRGSIVCQSLTLDLAASGCKVQNHRLAPSWSSCDRATRYLGTEVLRKLRLESNHCAAFHSVCLWQLLTQQICCSAVCHTQRKVEGGDGTLCESRTDENINWCYCELNKVAGSLSSRLHFVEKIENSMNGTDATAVEN